MEVIEESDLCFPHLFNASCKKILRPYYITVLVYSVLYFISLVTTILNLMHVFLSRQLHTPTNLLLLSLAISDFCVGLCMFFQILSVDGCWLLGDILCIVYQLVSCIVTWASMATVVLISVDRYIAICQPLHYYTKVTENKVRVCICLSWFGSTFYNMLMLKENMERHQTPHTFTGCSGECVAAVNYYVGLIDIFISFIIPVSAIAVLYIRVFIVVTVQVRAMRSQITAVKSQRIVFANKSELKAARTLGVVIVMFIICFCPYYIAIIGQDTSFSVSSAAVVMYLFYINSCLNPLIYTFFYPWFRKCLKYIVTLQILQPSSSRACVLSSDF